MIDIKSLTEKNKGQKVLYRGDEEGVITSWNDRYIFVRFRGPNGAACNPEDLVFLIDWFPALQAAKGGDNVG